MAMGGRAVCVCVRVAAAGQGMCRVRVDCGGLQAASAAHAQKKVQGPVRGWHRGQLQAARGPCSALARPLLLVLPSIARHSCRQSAWLCLSMVGIIKLQSCKTVMLQRRRGAEVQSYKAPHSSKPVSASKQAHLQMQQMPSLPTNKAASNKHQCCAGNNICSALTPHPCLPLGSSTSRPALLPAS